MGGDDDSTTADVATVDTGAVEPTQPADGSSDTLPSDADPPDATGADQCTVEVTGDATARWTSPGGSLSVGNARWVPPDVADMLNPLPTYYFKLGCSDDASASFVNFYAGFSATEADIPYGPAVYTLNLVPGGDERHSRVGDTWSISYSSNPDDPIFAEVVVNGDRWDLTEPGTLEITAFDEQHIAGRFELAVTNAYSGGTARITGEFDYRNPN